MKPSVVDLSKETIFGRNTHCETSKGPGVMCAKQCIQQEGCNAALFRGSAADCLTSDVAAARKLRSSNDKDVVLKLAFFDFKESHQGLAQATATLGMGAVPWGRERTVPPFPLLAARQDRAEPRPRLHRSSNSPHRQAPAFSGAEPLPGDLLAARQRLAGLLQGLRDGAGEACFSPFPADAAPRCPSLSWEIAPTPGHKLPHLDLARQPPPGKPRCFRGHGGVS